MVPGGVTEIVYHFAGYLHLITETAKDRIVYDNGGVPIRPDDYVANLRENVIRPDLEEFKTEKFPDTPFESSEPDKPNELHASFLRPLKPFRDGDDDVADSLIKLPSMTRPPLAGGQFDLSLKIHITYRPGGEQQLLDVMQLNNMEDDDHLLVRDGSAVTALHGIDADHVLQGLIDTAEAQIPSDLAMPFAGTTAAAEFLAARDAEIAANGGGDGEHSVPFGRYVNGQPQSAPDNEPPPPEEPAPPDLAAKGQWAMLGGNEAINAALIVDLKEAANTMIVLGDYFKTNAIIQGNAYIDNDYVEVAGGAGYAPIVVGDNAADNIAEFAQRDGLFAGMPLYHAGLQWNVQVVEGDFYDVNLVYQKNILRDNDVAVQDTQYTHYEAHLGENQQINFFQLFSGEVKYDLIVVCGNFHAANLIFQYNVLLDNDVAKIAADGESADTTSQSATTGKNDLLNDAVIVGYGDNFFAVPGEDLDAILQALADRSTSLDPSLGWLLPGNGSGVLNVLYVTGDYYDINAIWQVNVFADVDTAIQYLGIADPKGGDTFSQNASIGGNSLTNDAAIVDVGATNSLVAGGVYQDTILIQANLVTDNADKIVYADPNKLITEVIAFTGEDDTQTAETDLPETGGSDLNGDPMGSILT
jgi:hypothetical protein